MLGTLRLLMMDQFVFVFVDTNIIFQAEFLTEPSSLVPGHEGRKILFLITEGVALEIDRRKANRECRRDQAVARQLIRELVSYECLRCPANLGDITFLLYPSGSWNEVTCREIFAPTLQDGADPSEGQNVDARLIVEAAFFKKHRPSHSVMLLTNDNFVSKRAELSSQLLGFSICKPAITPNYRKRPQA
ncbi:MAG: hypothetical protein JST40_12725 [Armatimonadetes bacterium]|nr:hypothetical protein [Armatimonadota bacterium]